MIKRREANELLGWDVFISHASEDKEPFVRQLANELTGLGLKVWYDEFELKVGVSLSRSIDIGLTNSRYGVVVLSSAFFGKDWPEQELDALLTRDIGGKTLILPLWYGVDREDVAKYSAILADRFALKATTQNISSVANELLAVIRPELFAKRQESAVLKTETSWLGLDGSPLVTTIGPTRIVIARFPPLATGLPDVEEVLTSAVRAGLRGYPEIEVERLDRPVPTEENEAYQAVSAASASGASVLLAGNYAATDRGAILSLLLHIAGNPLQQAVSLRKTVVGTVREFQRTDNILEVARNIISLAFYIAGIVRHLRGDSKGAIELFTNSLNSAKENEKLWPDRIYELRGVAFFLLGDDCNAIADYTKSLEVKPGPGAYANRGTARIRSGDLDGSLRDLNEALASTPESPLLLTMRAAAYHAQKQYTEALQDLDAAMRLLPNTASYYNRGNVYYDLGELDKAIGDYDRAIELDPKNSSALARKGFALSLQGKHQEAFTNYKRAIAIDPANAGFYGDGAKTLLQSGDPQQALEYCNQAIAHNPQFTDAYRTRGCVFMRLDDFESAAKDFSEVLDRGATLPENFVNRALANKGRGAVTDAVSDYEKALSLARSNGNETLAASIESALTALRAGTN
jgi:tetratricopeptide (TPR) repeat protein